MRNAKNDNEKKRKKKVGALLAAGLLATGLLMAAGAADAASSVTLTGTIGQREEGGLHGAHRALAHATTAKPLSRGSCRSSAACPARPS